MAKKLDWEKQSRENKRLKHIVKANKDIKPPLIAGSLNRQLNITKQIRGKNLIIRGLCPYCRNISDDIDRHISKIHKDMWVDHVKRQRPRTRILERNLQRCDECGDLVQANSTQCRCGNVLPRVVCKKRWRGRKRAYTGKFHSRINRRIKLKRG